MRELPESIQNEICTMYTEAYKMSVHDIAEEVGCADSAVYDCLRRHGIEIVNRRSEHKYDELDVESIVADYKEDGGAEKEWKYSLAEILAKYGIGMNRFYALLRFVGVEPRKIAAQVTRGIRMDYAVEMYQRGDSMASIQADTGIAPGSLHMELPKRGIKPNRRRKFPVEAYEEACKLYIAGMPLDEIYVKTGVSNTAPFYRELKKRGIPLRYNMNKQDGLAEMFKAAPKDLQELIKAALGPDSSQTSSE